MDLYCGRSRKKWKKIDQLVYRLCLARQLIDGFTSRKSRGRPANHRYKKKVIPDEVRLVQVGKHMPSKNSYSTYRRCKLCSTTKLQKRTRIACTHCEVPLCLEPCFTKFHSAILLLFLVFIVAVIIINKQNEFCLSFRLLTPKYNNIFIDFITNRFVFGHSKMAVVFSMHYHYKHFSCFSEINIIIFIWNRLTIFISICPKQCHERILKNACL